MTALLLAVWVSSPAVAQETRIDELFAQLREADPAQAARLQGQIRDEWSRSGSPTMDLLLRRGTNALDSGDAAQAVEHLTALIDHAPDFAEGYHMRATAYYELGLVGPAIEDLRETLALNPRHFGAMTGFAVIFMDIDRMEDALAVFRQIAEIGPNLPDVADAISRLEREIDGQSI